MTRLPPHKSQCSIADCLFIKKKKKNHHRLFGYINNTYILPAEQERETNDLFQLPFNEAPLASAHTRQLTVSLWHPLNLEKPFSQITLPLANA